MNDPMQEAEALLALEAHATPGPWSLDPRYKGVRQPFYSQLGRIDDGWGQVSHHDAELIVALRNCAPAVIRVLMKRVVFLEKCVSSQQLTMNAAVHDASRIESLEADLKRAENRIDVWREKFNDRDDRVESLEAERELLQERSGVQLVNEKGQCVKWPPLTPYEIAARVEQKRKDTL